MPKRSRTAARNVAIVNGKDIVPPVDPITRIGQKIKRMPDGCWLYDCEDGDTSKYRQVQVGRMLTSAHRFVYITLVGPVPKGWHLHHECETPSCVNPDHLVPMTPSDHKSEHHRLRAAAKVA